MMYMVYKMKKKKTEKELYDFGIEASKIAKEFDECQNFLRGAGILREAERSYRYYEGDQWYESTKKFDIEPPVVNFIQNLVDTKAASVNSKNFRINYVIDDDTVSTDNVTKFAEYQMKEMGQDRLNHEATYDALLAGTAIWYFTWDEDAVGQMGTVDGGINPITLSLEDVALANVREENLDKQEYIIVRSRERISKIKEMCSFMSDEDKDKYFVAKPTTTTTGIYATYKTNEELDVFTKFFKQNGEVYFTKSTREMMIQEAVSLNPLTNKAVLKRQREEEKNEEKDLYKVDDQNHGMFEKPHKSEAEALKSKFKMNMYPLVFISFVKRHRCAFGKSWASQHIAIQRINNNLEYSAYIGATKSALPTIVVKEGALSGRSIDLSKPNSIIVDRTPHGVDGIKLLNTGSIPTTHFTLASETVALIKDVYRANEVLHDGNNVASNASGTAISQLLSIQEKPVQQWQNALVRGIEREGKILEMFYKGYYRNKTFSAKYSEAELMAMNQGQIDGMSTRQTSMFNGADYLETPFNVSVEVGEGGKFSQIASQQAIDTLFLNGTIDKLSTNSLMWYTELSDETFFPKKKQLRKLVEQREQSEVAQLQQQVQQLTSALQMASAQNESMKQEYTNKLNIYNQQIRQAEQMLKAQKQTSQQGDK